MAGRKKAGTKKIKIATFKKPDFSKKGGFKISAKSLADIAAKSKASKIQNQSQPHGFGADPDFLPVNVRKALEAALDRSKLAPPLRNRLVDHANHLAQMPDDSREPGAEQVASIEAVTASACELLVALSSLSPETIELLSMHSRELCVLRTSPLSDDISQRLLTLESRGLLEECWDWVNALDAVGEHAAEGINVSRNNKVNTEVPARALVARLAGFYLRMTGTTPPKDPASWFAQFARVLGTFMGVHFEDEDMKPIQGKPFIGPGPLKSGILLATKKITDGATPAEVEAWNEVIARDLAEVRARPPQCKHDWPMPLYPPVSQNCRNCGGGLNGAPDQ